MRVMMPHAKFRNNRVEDYPAAGSGKGRRVAAGWPCSAPLTEVGKAAQDLSIDGPSRAEDGELPGAGSGKVEIRANGRIAWLADGDNKTLAAPRPNRSID
jgi:hypothetical protein